jgi:hypothetical protein
LHSKVGVRNFRSGSVGNRAAVSRHTDADFQPDEEVLTPFNGIYQGALEALRANYPT